MKVRVWNAYASNNSGSYTIVGQLPSQEVALAVAAELETLIAAHTAWLAAAEAAEPNREPNSVDSPLAAFCRDNKLHWVDGQDLGDAWPQYSNDNRPRVVVVGRQVVVHHEYTVSLPPTFGELFYKRGGRVQIEENHAHAPIVAIATYWWGHSTEDRARQAVERPKLVAALTGSDGPLAREPMETWPAAWRVADEHFMDAPLTVGAVFKDLIEGVALLRDGGTAHGARMLLQLHEAPNEKSDPLFHLRPSQPALPRFDLVLVAAVNRQATIDCLEARLGMRSYLSEDKLEELPFTLARGLQPASAESTAGALRAVGATVELVRNDG